MANVSVEINGRGYLVTCDPGQEDRIRALGRHIDGHVRTLVEGGVRTSDINLLLLAALTVADEYFEARAAANPDQARANGSGVPEEELARILDGMADRVEGIAARLREA
ncbi:cell division protein ZapA [Futiania mangrovi]|uniref:Cell division protein ZapA n=1 Tax=Futiania mangrovi TaxID=2959716 RepID=A0A9J6PBG4_9PROT|nr:cell division protein ZapA [Futiania mangrovii]MCP1334883.1 cell division protein ZapA [Futiania mangrovii]